MRGPVTFESAARLCPDEGMVSRIVAAFGLEPVKYHAIREATEEGIGTMTKALAPILNERALEMHLQRVVGSFVGPAHEAGGFYDSKAEQARNLSSAIRNEDRLGVDGMDNRAARARAFAATAAVQAYAVLAAAQGAVDAYAAITGQDRKPYVGRGEDPRSVDQKAAATRLAAFERG